MNSKASKSLLGVATEALQTTSRATRIQRRTFSQSCQRRRYGPVSEFTNLSNPELSTLLNTLREKVIMPSHLSAQQRKLIYKERHRKDLLMDPIVVNLAGEDFTLQPIDRTRDLPALKKSLFQALDLMETTGDFDNVPNLLKGLKQSHLATKDTLICKVIAKLAQAGRHSVIMQCARKGEETGFDLREYEVVRQILWAVEKVAVDADFEAGQTQKALRWAEQVFELIELPNACGKGVATGKIDPRVEPLTVGILLELAAVRAERHLGGKDVDGKVAEYSKRLLATGVNLGAPENLESTSRWLGGVVPVVFGIKTALKVLDPNSSTSDGLRSKYATLEKDLAQRRTEYLAWTKKDKSLQGVELYDKLLGGSQ